MSNEDECPSCKGWERIEREARERAIGFKAQRDSAVALLRKWEHWYSVDSSEFNRDTAHYDTAAFLEGL